ncbi:MAG: dihydroorotate dehydrogenase [Candidatus Bilamarchaeaceae archaeon]
MTNITVNLAGMKLKNPTILASGIRGLDKESLEYLVNEGGAGAVTTKSITMEPRAGHNAPILVRTGCGFLNAVGYANNGIEKGVEEFSGWKLDAPLILSLVGKNADEFKLLAKKAMDISPKVAAVELALSCPHTPGYGMMAGQGTPEETAKITKTVKDAVSVPVIVKLSPNTPGLGETAKAAEKAGADIINMGNSVGPGMAIDIERKRPVLGFRFGGLSGPAIKPIAVRCVYDVYSAVDVPIIGTGGVTDGEDAVEMIMAGASAVGVGTALHYRGPDAFRKISEELAEWMKAHGVKSVKEIIGVANEKKHGHYC